MAKIKVEQPFTVRREGEAELLAFTLGVHEVDEDVISHWFVQACIKDGRAVLLDGAVQDVGTGLEAQQGTDSPLTEEVLRAKTNRELNTLAALRGLPVPEKATKEQLVSLIFDAQEA